MKKRHSFIQQTSSQASFEIEKEEAKIVDNRKGDFKSVLFLKAWNVLSALGLIVPLIVFTYARISNQDDNQDYGGDDADREYQNFKSCDGDNQAWWKYWCHDDDQAGDEDRDADGDMAAPWWCK